jgi:hypothetical protein
MGNLTTLLEAQPIYHRMVGSVNNELEKMQEESVEI